MRVLEYAYTTKLRELVFVKTQGSYIAYLDAVLEAVLAVIEHEHHIAVGHLKAPPHRRVRDVPQHKRPRGPCRSIP
eukprot:3092830-Pyramimonas_sp.AAC.1